MTQDERGNDSHRFFNVSTITWDSFFTIIAKEIEDGMVIPFRKETFKLKKMILIIDNLDYQ